MFNVFPDNERRAERVAQLTDQALTAVHELGGLKQRFDEAIAKANAAYRAALQNADKGVSFRIVSPFEREQVVASHDNIVFKLPALIASIAAGTRAAQAIETMYIKYLLSQGKNLEAVFMPLVGAPNWWFKFVKVGGGALASVGAAAVTQLLADTVDRGIQRSRLRDALQETPTPRFIARRALRLNTVLVTHVEGMALAYESFVDVIADFPEELRRKKIDDYTDKAMAKLKANLDAVSDVAVLSELSDLDKSMNAYIEEDGKPDVNYVPGTPG